MTPTRRSVLALLAATPAVALAPAANAAPQSKLISEHWTQFGDVDAVDHSLWADLLTRFRSENANGVSLFAYGNVDAAAKAALDQYVAQLEATTPTRLTRAAAYAYWANLYNAVTVKLVLEAYPVDSIKEVRGGFFNTGPWRDQVVTVEDRALSLDDIEHGIMRPVLTGPRIHYAVNCAAIGCPNLGPRPFTAADLEQTLDQNARAYVNDPRGARFDSRGRLIVSSIYEWFKEDFGGTDAGVIAHLAAYAEPELATKLATVDRIYDDAYDWSLNVSGGSA